MMIRGIGPHLRGGVALPHPFLYSVHYMSIQTTSCKPELCKEFARDFMKMKVPRSKFFRLAERLAALCINRPL